LRVIKDELEKNHEELVKPVFNRIDWKDKTIENEKYLFNCGESIWI
jgi:hypothetical protein